MNGMPILEPKGMLPIPWPLIVAHGIQAQRNHGQSLRRLAERGGVSVTEAVAVLEDRPWKPMDDVEAIKRLGELMHAEMARLE